MAGKRKLRTAAFKAQVALAALKGDRTANELAGHYGVHPTLIHGWKKQLLTGAEGIFGSPAQAASADAEARQAELFEQIGRLKMELEWLKKTTIRHRARNQRKTEVTPEPCPQAVFEACMFQIPACKPPTQPQDSTAF